MDIQIKLGHIKRLVRKNRAVKASPKSIKKFYTTKFIIDELDALYGFLTGRGYTSPSIHLEIAKREAGNGKVLYEKKGSDTFEPTEDIDEAQIFCSGSLKFDGCMNFSFDEQEECMLHTCHSDDALNIGKILARVYELGKEVIPNNIID